MSTGATQLPLLNGSIAPGVREEQRARDASKAWAGHSHRGLPWHVICGDARTALRDLQAESVSCVVTSPPYYWQRDYKVENQIGLEPTIAGYVNNIASVMDDVHRVLRRDGLLFLNLGDTYYSAKGQPKGKDKKNWARRFGLRAVDTSGLGVPKKTAIGLPWRVALEMIDRGWVLRCPIVWRRDKATPEPTAKDRPWRTHEMIFMFSKSTRYHFSREYLGKDEDVWRIHSQSKNTNNKQSAYFPESLVERCLKIGCAEGGLVLDPFAGTGTTLRVALRLGHGATGVEISRAQCDHMVQELSSL